MKKLLFIPLVLLAALAGYAQLRPKKKVHTQNKVKELPDSVTIVPINPYNKNIDHSIKGPHGEDVYIGPNGGRYYMKGSQKMYLANKAAKKKP